MLDSIDWLYAEAEETGTARILAFAVHPYLSGVPHRVGYLREGLEQIVKKPGVVVWNGEQILDWYLKERPL